MRIGIAVGSAIVLAIVCGVLVFQVFFHEPQRANGPLSEALIEAYDPDQRGQNLDAVFAEFITVDLPLDQREPVLLANGFDCVIEPAMVEGSSILVCRRPIAGTGYCEGFHYYSYQTAADEIIETMGTTYSVEPRNRGFGRCENWMAAR